MRSWARVGGAVAALVVAATACAERPAAAPPTPPAAADAGPPRPGPNQVTAAQLWGRRPGVVVHESPLRVEWRTEYHPASCAWQPGRDRVEISGLDVSRLAGPPLHLGEVVAVTNSPPPCDYGCDAPSPPGAPELVRAPEIRLGGAATLLVHEAPGRPTLYVYADGTIGWDLVRHVRLRPEQVDRLIALVEAIGADADVAIDDSNWLLDAPTVLLSRGGLRRVLLDGREAAPLALALDAIERQLAADLTTYLRSWSRHRASILEWEGAFPLATLVPGGHADAAAATVPVPPRLWQAIRPSVDTRYFRERGRLYQVVSQAGRTDYASLRVVPCVDATLASRHDRNEACYVWPASWKLRLADTLVPGGVPVPPEDAALVTNAAFAGHILQDGYLYYGVAIDRVERGQVSRAIFERRRDRTEADDRTFAEAFARVSAGPHDHALSRLAAVCATLPSCAGTSRSCYAALGRGVPVEKAFAPCAGRIDESDARGERVVPLADRVGASLHDYAEDVARARPELQVLLTPETLAGWLPPGSRELDAAAPCADLVTRSVDF